MPSRFASWLGVQSPGDLRLGIGFATMQEPLRLSSNTTVISVESNKRHAERGPSGSVTAALRQELSVVGPVRAETTLTFNPERLPAGV
jgi:hypothetical protein